VGNIQQVELKLKVFLPIVPVIFPVKARVLQKQTKLSTRQLKQQNPFSPTLCWKQSVRQSAATTTAAICSRTVSLSLLCDNVKFAVFHFIRIACQKALNTNINSNMYLCLCCVAISLGISPEQRFYSP